MNPLFYCFLLCLIGGIFALVANIQKEKRASSEKYQEVIASFYRQATQMLEPGECIEAYCGYNPCAAVTNRRLLVMKKNEIEAIPFSQIRKVKGMGFSGNTTKKPDQMQVFEVKADKKYVLANQSDGFVQVVEALNRHLQNR